MKDDGPLKDIFETIKVVSAVLSTAETVLETLDDHLDEHCFITTAVCKHLGKPDDCYELTQFRAFRDDWLAKQPDGQALIDDYYKVAPMIVKQLEQLPVSDKEHAYQVLWERYLAKCLALIEAGQFEHCKSIYIEMVEKLKVGFY